ncbi:MAG: exodeoxyribonuclease III [Candidatus Marinimicrobia bacterium]|nr:exodeoxyribonuclease III [Candidatus Neomarinimicrobiota bacterium]MCF7839805.1 exodeoxyribonuclease III [Candidatus Neomarinimicrobiota bacterium]MCF7901839.1 exodeoxyribonuclease III [Candidatus Neomarinimicrobiota bacterium]
MRIISWNLNGIRAVLKKGFWDWFNHEQPNILCLQETKAQPDQLDDDILNPPGYTGIWHSAERKGYSSVATFTKPKPLHIENQFLDERFNREGRTILCEYPQFFLYNIYFPNGQRDEERLRYKLEFYDELLDHARTTMQRKPVIIVGDYNTAHTEIDLARPKQNEEISGFLPEEREWVDRYLSAGLVDVFREEHPGVNGYYTWWTYRANARINNVGWRIDYFLVSQDFVSHVDAARIHPDVMGSDHCPISLTLNF